MSEQQRRQVDTGTEELLCEIRERVATITLNRPQARNSLSDALSSALREMIVFCAGDPEVGAVLIIGAGKAFCAGGDVKGMGDRSAKREQDPQAQAAAMKLRHRATTGALAGLRKPTIAALPGPAVGAGLSLALACDMRIAAESAFISTGYARIGLSGDYGIASLLTRAVGNGRARELMYLSERIDARRCEAIGLVNRVVPDDQLPEAAFALARTLANGPTVAFGLIKDNLDDALHLDYLEAIDREAERLVRSAVTADHREAVQAFIEKRAPAFSGR